MSLFCQIQCRCNITQSFPALNALPSIITVRWRKPRHLPKAKTKEFVVRKPTPIDPVENVELRKRFNNYATYTRGIRAYISDMFYEERMLQKAVKLQETLSAREEEWNRMKTVNDRWNENMRIKREARQNIEAEESRKELERLSAKKAEKAIELKEMAAQRLKYEIEQSQNFVTRENFDEMFDAMTSPELEFSVGEDGKPVRAPADTTIKTRLDTILDKLKTFDEELETK